jgi:hypothetical protein
LIPYRSWPYGFFLLLFPACRHCLGISPASPGPAAEIRTANVEHINIIVLFSGFPSTYLPAQALSEDQDHDQPNLAITSPESSASLQTPVTSKNGLNGASASTGEASGRSPGWGDLRLFLRLTLAPAGAVPAREACAAPQEEET